MKNIILSLCFSLLYLLTSAQKNEKLITIIKNDYDNSKEWVEQEMQKLTIDQKLGLYLILDGRNNSFSENVELINKYQPAGLLTKIKSLTTFASAVNFYKNSDKGTLIVLDSKSNIGIPSTDAIKYPKFETIGAVQPLKKLIYLGNDLAEQMQRIGVDLIFTNSSAISKYQVIERKLEALQKGLWYKKRFMFYYQSDNLSISTKYLSKEDFIDIERPFIVTENINDALRKLKSAYSYGQITDDMLNAHTKLVLQMKYRTDSYNKPEVNLKLLKEDLNQRKYLFTKHDIENCAITLVRNPDQFIPLVVGSTENLSIACIAFGAEKETEFQKKIKKYNNSKNFQFSEKDSLPQFYAIEEQLENKKIIFFEIYPTQGKEIPASWGTFIEKLNHTKKIVVTVFGKPDYLQQLKRLPTYLTVIVGYENTKNIAQTTAEMIFGEKPIYGTLPYTAGFPYKANDRKEIKKTKRYVNENYKNPPKRELRAAWIATVLNIDWPSKASLNESEERAEFVKMLNMHKKNNINAVICQISPSADAFYPSKILPWSQWLTGKSGLEPEVFYDPLKFMIEECHKRNIEFHAWFNPYRVKVNLKYEMSYKHASNKYPNLMLTYGNKMYYDPGYEQTRNIVTSAIMEVVHNYDIDGIHFDDYFYPYKIHGKEFPDSLSFEKEPRGFAKNQKDDWRRDNVNLFIQMLHDSIKAVKPWVKFGISPFGVWRNQYVDASGSDTKAGVTNYDNLYADIMLWLKNNWIDYVMPQVYWERGKKVADFSKIIDWWSKNNYNKPVYIGHGIYKTDKNSKTPAWRDVSEIPSQIELVRTYPELEGSAFFSSKTFAKNPMGITDILRKKLFKYPALIPQMPLIDNTPPDKPYNLTSKKMKGYKKKIISWQADTTGNEMDKAKYFMVYKFEGEEIGDISKPENFYTQLNAPYLEEDMINGIFRRKKYTFVITAFDRLNNESEESVIVVKL